MCTAGYWLVLKNMTFRGGFLAGPQRVSVFCVPPLAPPKSFPTNVFLCFCFLSEVIFGRVPSVLLCLVTPPWRPQNHSPPTCFLILPLVRWDWWPGSALEEWFFLFLLVRNNPPPPREAGGTAGGVAGGWVGTGQGIWFRLQSTTKYFEVQRCTT